jgi:hypothetical protein
VQLRSQPRMGTCSRICSFGPDWEGRFLALVLVAVGFVMFEGIFLSRTFPGNILQN